MVAWLVELVTGLAWLGALVLVGLFIAVWVQLNALVRAQRRTDERLSDLERAIGTGGGD